MTHKPTTTTAAADDDDDDVEGTGGSMGGWMAEWPRDKDGEGRAGDDNDEAAA